MGVMEAKIMRGARLAGAVTAGLLALLAAVPAQATSLTRTGPVEDKSLALPAPTGAQPVGTVSLHLVDRGRPDPWVPSEKARELMVSLWYPAEKGEIGRAHV